MKTLSIKVTNENGLTSRLAAELVAEANKHIARCTMVVDKDDPSQQADLKSIMNVFTLSIPKGGSFDIVIEGADEESAYMAFFHLLESLPL
jgi:phosphotransferase system HPr (HPr) family protein